MAMPIKSRTSVTEYPLVRLRQNLRAGGQHPHPQRLMMSGQHRAGEAVEATHAHLTPVALPVWLSVIMTIARDQSTVTAGATNPGRPAKLRGNGRPRQRDPECPSSSMRSVGCSNVRYGYARR